MKSGDSGEWIYAKHAYFMAGTSPLSFANMDPREKAIIIAFIDLELKARQKGG